VPFGTLAAVFDVTVCPGQIRENGPVLSKTTQTALAG